MTAEKSRREYMTRQEAAKLRASETARYGIPVDSTIAIGFYGTMKDVRSRYGLLKGIERICTELSPHTLVCYGNEIKSINSMCKKVIFLENYCKSIKKRVK